MRALQDVLADKTRKRVSEGELYASYDNLARIIRQNFVPNLVVAIDTGGSIPGEMIAQRLKIPIVHITVRRSIKITRRYGNDPVLLRWVMSVYHHYLFRLTKPVISVDINTDISGKNILVVDDSIHTGATIDVVTDHLRRAGAHRIVTASLTYVSENKPDYSVIAPGNYSFPWSKDYNNIKPSS